MPRIDRIFAKSVYTNEQKVIRQPYITSEISEKSSNDFVKERQIAPKQNYSKVDTRFVNRNAHKGPDEI